MTTAPSNAELVRRLYDLVEAQETGGMIRRETGLDVREVMRMLPHRYPFLLIDRVTGLDRERSLMVASYDLKRAETVFSGHFPGAPVWPGVLQVEAVAQAGLLLTRLLAEGSGFSPERPTPNAERPTPALTQILAAQFMKPIGPDGQVDIAARIVEDGLFVIIIGQCLWNGQVCSAAAVRGL